MHIYMYIKLYVYDIMQSFLPFSFIFFLTEEMLWGQLSTCFFLLMTYLKYFEK